MYAQGSSAGGGSAFTLRPYVYGRGTAQLNHSTSLYPSGDGASAHPNCGSDGATTTYQDALGGFALDYPVGWHLYDVSPEIKEQSVIYSAVLTSWEPVEGGGEGIPPDGTKVDVTVFKAEVANLEAAVAERRQQLAAEPPAPIILSEEAWSLAGGLPTLRWRLQSERAGESTEVITVINRKTVLITGLGNLALAEAVARTLQVSE
jgi:hypothetical protein